MRPIARVAGIAAIFISIAFSQCCAKDGVDVSAYADRKAITIGERILLTVDVSSPAGTEVQMPQFKEGAIGDFEIKESSRRMVDRLFRSRMLRSSYYITSYSAGRKSIPKIDVKYKLRASKEWALIKTSAIPIDVRSVLPKEFPPDIKDIKGPISFFEINWFLVLPAAALIAALAVALVIYIRIRNRKPVRLPHETALEELESIRSALAASGNVKEYFAGVSDCIRRYIERVFNLRAPEMTTEEFLNSLGESAALNVSHKEPLKGFLSACDLVKFADYSPSKDETENVYITAKKFVEETKPQPPEAQGAAAGARSS